MTFWLASACLIEETRPTAQLSFGLHADILVGVVTSGEGKQDAGDNNKHVTWALHSLLSALLDISC